MKDPGNEDFSTSFPGLFCLGEDGEKLWKRGCFFFSVLFPQVRDRSFFMRWGGRAGGIWGACEKNGFRGVDIPKKIWEKGDQ